MNNIFMLVLLIFMLDMMYFKFRDYNFLVPGVWLMIILQGASTNLAPLLRANISNSKAWNSIKLGFKWKLLFSTFRGCPWIWDLDLNCPRYARKRVSKDSFEILRFSSYIWAKEKSNHVTRLIVDRDKPRSCIDLGWLWRPTWPPTITQTQTWDFRDSQPIVQNPLSLFGFAAGTLDWD